MNKFVVLLALLLAVINPCFADTNKIKNLSNDALTITDSQTIDIPVQEPTRDLPINVRLSLNINKIYDIRPVDESFNVDAYLGADWLDIRAGVLVPHDKNYITLEDAHVDEWHEHVWIPSLEIINVLGPKDISNKRLIIYKDGRVFYNERFNATLQSSIISANFHLIPKNYKL
uniref:Molybdopterin-guanine dinucleotide biosynthesis protein A n=1 Tax=uncultured organism TaxID=155900 RepID=D8VMT5_9ZZZZ|nr:molybdopterin-guanine dinucleotide biosynthesis protein A [uncultured organism]